MKPKIQDRNYNVGKSSLPHVYPWKYRPNFIVIVFCRTLRDETHPYRNISSVLRGESFSQSFTRTLKIAGYFNKEQVESANETLLEFVIPFFKLLQMHFLHKMADLRWEHKI